MLGRRAGPADIVDVSAACRRAVQCLSVVSADEFRQLLLNEPLDELVTAYVLGGDAFAFRDDLRAYAQMVDHLSARLEVHSASITVVGSAKLGFSLNPMRFPRSFRAESDIDVLVVDERLFDTAWFAMLDWNYLRRHRLPAPEFRWARKRWDDIYWGWFTPDRIRYEGLLFPESLEPIRDLSARWFDAFQSLGLLPAFADRQVSGRLYRTWGHAHGYHAAGLRRLRSIAIEMQGSGP